MSNDKKRIVHEFDMKQRGITLTLKLTATTSDPNKSTSLGPSNTRICAALTNSEISTIFATGLPKFLQTSLAEF